jgi:hypothetical protein
MFDVTCFVGAGPLASSTPAALGELLRRSGVTSAAVSPMAGLFVSDPTVNDVLRDLPPFFVPVPIVDPRWPPRVLASYRKNRAVRVVPGSHGYPASEARALDMPVILQMRVADPRNLPSDLPLPEVDVAEAVALSPMVVTGARAHELSPILTATQALADLSLAEQPDVVRRAVATFGADRLLIGTHAPFLTPEAARQKLLAARLPQASFAALTSENAARLNFILR